MQLKNFLYYIDYLRVSNKDIAQWLHNKVTITVHEMMNPIDKIFLRKTIKN